MILNVATDCLNRWGWLENGCNRGFDKIKADYKTLSKATDLKLEKYESPSSRIGDYEVNCGYWSLHAFIARPGPGWRGRRG